ncbi:MAG: hypothetical protein A2665_00385 [Candidatus Zambryskibacteria bacterium RIFCSPHIGHO2_01_FULL_46_30]|uniref:Uncharacterized protein n=1 Tax=Candidatus Zambryskibacteria bacterium RIFCSPHIGHO2_01_FULL_46_30 TaxID=1802739 RepID=A0A1G2T563_9BACT|nr:MAG: hypothetical protein A2665_00385 [Candidatus Zambryskibacteria bacterium RIFCSPHIGHO2_01_FULL_46_30]OHB05962.1 MAG: hypothetical protein A3B22_01150 [Candidatus Zambryskibacteria bacterium RIFCSPLOWO2_01_FULL_47_33]
MEDPQASLKKSGWKVRGRLGFGTSPEADWKIIVISTMVLTVLVVALSIWIFIKVNEREFFTVEPLEEERGKTLDTLLLRKTVLYYQNKALEFDRIKNAGTSTVADPSL